VNQLKRRLVDGSQRRMVGRQCFGPISTRKRRFIAQGRTMATTEVEGVVGMFLSEKAVTRGRKEGGGGLTTF
jgi:hypothetical protein